MNRRSFLAALAALPGLRWLRPQPRRQRYMGFNSLQGLRDQLAIQRLMNRHYSQIAEVCGKAKIGDVITVRRPRRFGDSGGIADVITHKTYMGPE